MQALQIICFCSTAVFRLNGNTHSIEASTLAEAERIAESRQKHNVDTARVETRLLYKIE